MHIISILKQDYRRFQAPIWTNEA